MSFKIIALVLAVAVTYADAHGYLKEPIARTSIQLRPEFGTQQPYWWDNTGVSMRF
jgi:predicted carbohydrate-binding protein with CBM5 and CBM33 domain